MARLPACVLALLCAASAVPAAARADAQWLGFNGTAALTRELTADQDARLLALAGANSVRLTVDWSWVQPFGAPINVSFLRPIYAAYERRGIRPIIVVMGAPRWAWNKWVLCFRPDCHVPPDRIHDKNWARFVAAVVRAFPDAAAIEIWNEPNLGGFYSPGPDPARYTELLRIGRDAVKSVDPGMPVLGASLAPIMADVETPQVHGMRGFLEAMYANGARGLMDGISVHGYPDGVKPRRIFDAVATAVSVRDGAGDTVPLWVTEVGASTRGGFTPVGQAILLARVLPRLIRHPDVAAVYVHTLVEPRRGGSSIEAGYGVLRYGGAPKPAFCAVAAAFGGPAPCAQDAAR